MRAADKLKKADAEQLVSYLGSPNGSTVLALVAEKLAKNTRLYLSLIHIWHRLDHREGGG